MGHIMGELRKDYILDRWVIIASERSKRPHEFKQEQENTNVEHCFFCPGNEQDTPPAIYEIEKDGKWQIRVFPNKFPAVKQKGNAIIKTDNSYYTYSDNYGQHLVLVETPDHLKEIHELPIDHIKKIINVYSEREESLYKIKKVRYVLVFKNEGGKAGESINHSHAQIMALPMVPPMIKEEIVAYDNYVMDNDSCPYCDIIKDERKSNRVAWEDKNIFALCPFASESPYGVWFIPKRHVRNLGEMNEDEKTSLAKALMKKRRFKINNGTPMTS